MEVCFAVWMVGSCLAVSGHEVLVWTDLYSRTLFVILYIAKGLASTVLCSRVEGGDQGRPRYFPAVVMEYVPCCPVY